MNSSKPLAPLLWQLLLTGLLGFSGVLFVPLLVRLLPADSMAMILVGQVAVYYLVLFVQYGFQWSGPAFLARCDSVGDQLMFWHRSIQTKFVLLLIGLGILASAIIWLDTIYLLVFMGLLAAFAVNSNWFLQARRDFKSGVLTAMCGVTLASLVLFGLWHTHLPPSLLPWLAVLVLILPQTLWGFGTWLVARRSTKVLSVNSQGNLSHLPAVSALLRAELPVVFSQLLLLGSTTLGTLVVGWMADAATATAYAATEKLFNLGATVIVGLYMAIYPRLAERFYQDPSGYVRFIWRFIGVVVVLGLTGLALFGFRGEALLRFYLGLNLASLVSTVLLPMTLWLTLCVSQHMVTGHLVFLERRSAVFWVNLLVLLVTVVVGLLAAQILPVYWVYGMLCGQVVALGLLIELCRNHAEVAV